jgi:hypothetical protein
LAHRIEWHDRWLSVSEDHQIKRIQVADGREVVMANIPEAVHHMTRTAHYRQGWRV